MMLFMKNKVSKVVEKAFGWLGQTSYPEAEFSHSLDESRMKESILTLYSFGEVFDDELSAYLIGLGWPKKAIEMIRKRFDDAASGKLKYKAYSEAFFREQWMIVESDLRPKEPLYSIESCNLWNGRKVVWKDLKDVNILVGINGSGKTTLLNRLYDYANGVNQKKNSLVITPLRNRLAPVTYIRAIDNSLVDKKKNESVLTRQLELVINQNPKTPSFFNYRLRALDDLKIADLIHTSIKAFFDIVNSFFAETGKNIEVSSNPARLFFKTKIGGEVDIDQLSSGEKQLLLILLQVFLQEKKKSILIMDEPEISLHIGWQQKLIDVICNMNPNCQLIIATHSPSIFGKGWGANIVYMEDIIKNDSEG